MRILVLGGASLDTIVHLNRFFPDVPQNVFAKDAYDAVGSTGSGKAFALRYLGFDVDFYAVLGDDAAAEVIRKECDAVGIGCLFETVKGDTERHVNLMNAEGDRISIFLNPSLPTKGSLDATLKQKMALADVIVLNINNDCRRLIPMVQAAKKPIWVDLHDYDGVHPYHQDFVQAGDVLFLSEDNRDVAQERLKALLDLGKSFGVATHGKTGATLMTKTKCVFEPADPVEHIVDTNGAGDSFFAGFLAYALLGHPLEDCLKAGIVAGATAVTSRTIANPDLTMDHLEEGIRQIRTRKEG